VDFNNANILMDQNWTLIPQLPDNGLADTRLQAHWAAQIVASVGYTFVAPVPDWAHVSLSFENGRLRGQSATDLGFFAALDLSRLTIGLLDGDSNQIIHELQLEGKTLNDGYAWLSSRISSLHPERDFELVRPDHELPTHPVGSGTVFDTVQSSDFKTLSALYDNSNDAIKSVIESESGASPVRCWPHHFDLASLISLDSSAGAENARSIGVGFSPGDGSYDHPYWYVTPWPYPSQERLRTLESAGLWHTEGWTGAVLASGTVTSVTSATEQEALVHDFLKDAISASRDALGK
jgi:hypothetical protein